MYNLIIKYNNQTIKSIIAYDCHRITGSGIEWVINAYQYYFNIDISEYSVKEIKLFEGGANLYIRPEDLQRIRNEKINSIL